MKKYQFTQDWFSADIPNLSLFLAPFKGKPIKMIEIGSFEGRSTVWFLENILIHPRASMTCIDTFAGSPEHQNIKINLQQLEKIFDYNIKTSGYSSKVFKIKGVSQEVLRKLPLYSYEIIYIDGSHKACDVLEDAVLSFRLLKKNGVMVFDDYIWPAKLPAIQKPKKGIDAFLDIYQGQYQILHRKGQLFIKKL